MDRRAVIAKPGWTVSWEEVGLAWFEVTVRGTHTYVGSRHRLPVPTTRSPAPGVVVRRLERVVPRVRASGTPTAWSRRRASSRRSRGGWERMAAVTPAVCRLRVDLRLGPRHDARAGQARVHAALADRAAARPGRARSSWSWPSPARRPTPTTGSARSAPAGVGGRRAVGRTRPCSATVGATDANILRSRGIPTVRVGMPKVTGPTAVGLDFAAGHEHRRRGRRWLRASDRRPSHRPSRSWWIGGVAA